MGRIGRLRFAWLLFLWGSLSSPPSGATEERLPPARSTLDCIDRARARGEIGYAEAARQTLLHLFDPDRMDPRWGGSAEGPARCGTLALAEIGANLDRLDAETRALYEEHASGADGGDSEPLAPQVFQSTHFYIEYSTSGPSAPPLADVNPANGIPDFVEWTAAACEFSWSTAVGALGYLAPQLAGGPSNKYLVQYQKQNSYGYTQVVSGQRTKIVLHPNYVGFPPNDDPDGDVIGALRATVAHELKHAIQRMYTLWTEGGWLELDATWMEDIVYDDVNDYYNYIGGSGSPFTEPQTSLDSGGSGSYEDCNWQHYQTEKLGNPHMLAFWQRRQLFSGEPVLTTYSANLAASGLPFGEAWGEYVAWNFAGGARADAGYGYGEAARYPTAPSTSTYAALPVPSTPGSVARLAANARLVDNADGGIGGTPEFTFSGTAGADWRVSALMRDRAGSLTRVPMTLSGGSGTLLLAGYDWANLGWAALLVGHAATAGPAASYTFSARAIAPIHIAHQRSWNTTDTSAPYGITALVTPGTGTPDPSTVSLTYRVNGGPQANVPMAPTANPNEYGAGIPPQPVGRLIEYRIEASSTLAEPMSSPALPGSFYAFEVVTVFEPFETSSGWTVGAPGDNATTGVWERVVPVGTLAAPAEDFTIPPGTMCFVTQNGLPGGAAGDADVDGGRTTLLSPVFDLAAGAPYARVVARYRRWYSNHLGATVDDVWRVDASNDGGSSWTNLETISLGSNAWVPVTVDLLALFGTPAQVRFRFVAEDAGQASLVEGGVDDFEIVAEPLSPVSVPGPSAVRLHLGPARPNPSPGPVALDLVLPASARVRATVRDLQGRTVRQLLSGSSPWLAGRRSIEWDGRDLAGAPSPPGVYFVEVETHGTRLERRVVLVR